MSQRVDIKVRCNCYCVINCSDGNPHVRLVRRNITLRGPVIVNYVRERKVILIYISHTYPINTINSSLRGSRRREKLTIGVECEKFVSWWREVRPPVNSDMTEKGVYIAKRISTSRHFRFSHILSMSPEWWARAGKTKKEMRKKLFLPTSRDRHQQTCNSLHFTLVTTIEEASNTRQPEPVKFVKLLANATVSLKIL